MNSAPSPYGTNCKHFDICGLPATHKLEGAYYCLLHHPQLNKNDGQFNDLLEAYLNDGRSDFRYFYFSDGYTLRPESRQFRAVADFRNAVFHSELNLVGAILPHGLILETQQINQVRLTDTSIDGDVTVRIAGKIDGLNAINARLSNLTFAAEHCVAVNFERAAISGKVNFNIDGQIQNLIFHHARLDGGLTVNARSITTISLNTPDTIIGDTSLKVAEQIAGIDGSSAQFSGGLSIIARRLDGLTLVGSKVDGLFTLRSNGTTINLTEAIINRGLDFKNCELSVGLSSFKKISFAESAEVDFDHSILHGNLSINAVSPPKSINLNGCVVTQNCVIRSDFGKHLIKLLAQENRPEFEGEVDLANVDLSQCRIVGNSVDKMRISNVAWHQRHGRSVLYDEIVLQAAGSATTNLKEAYQVLKEKYRQLGDHVTSGDFHFGEMQMKRREYSRLRRILGLEAWYYYLSEYGTNPKLAGLVLVGIILLFTWLFNLFGDSKPRQDLLEAFILSIQAATFQPIPLDGFNFSTRLLFLAERILAPLQIALLALAIRMRLKR